MVFLCVLRPTGRLRTVSVVKEYVRAFLLRNSCIKKAPLTPGPESHPWELNPKPGAYEASALPIELGWLLAAHIIRRIVKFASGTARLLLRLRSNSPYFSVTLSSLS